MADSKKYFWLKLKRDFFKRHDIQIIESMPNGKDYVLFYLKLLCESVDHEGNLRFSTEIPYTEEMLASITNTNPDVVKNAIKILTELRLMEIKDDETFFMPKLNEMLGFETEWAKKKKEYRDKQGQSEDNVLKMSSECPQSVLKMSSECPQSVLSMSDKSKSKSKSKNIYTATAKENNFTKGAKEQNYDFNAIENKIVKN